MIKALIVNVGKEPLKIELQPRDESGRFVEGAEWVVQPGEYVELDASEEDAVQIRKAKG